MKTADVKMHLKMKKQNTNINKHKIEKHNIILLKCKYLKWVKKKSNFFLIQNLEYENSLCTFYQKKNIFFKQLKFPKLIC